MKKQLVTYNIALAFRELDFDEECLFVYNSYKVLKCIISGTNPDIDDYVSFNKYDDRLPAPLWQQAVDWFREKYNIYINVLPITFDAEPTFIFEIISLKNGKLLNDVDSSFLDVNEAREQAILKAIELCQKEK